MRTLVGRANPLAQLAVGTFALIGSFWIGSLPVALIALGAYVAVALLVLPAWRYPVVCLGFTAFASVTIMYSTWRLGGRDLDEALTAGVRIIVLAWPGSVMAGFVDPTRLADYLAQSWRFPARMMAAFAAALQRFTGFAAAWHQLERVRRARGFGAGRNPFTNLPYVADMSFALLVHALRGATKTSIAMDARGFASARDRTWAEPAPWTRLDAGCVVVAVLLGAVAPIAAAFWP